MKNAFYIAFAFAIFSLFPIYEPQQVISVIADHQEFEKTMSTKNLNDTIIAALCCEVLAGIITVCCRGDWIKEQKLQKLIKSL